MTQATMWVMAKYLTHSFHYRMPDTVAISSINPVMPSPLTVQLAMIASFLREGDGERAQALLELMPLPVRVRPPQAALVFRSIMRYVRPPKDATDVDKTTGSSYKISPHYREFALLEDGLEIYVQTPSAAYELVGEALECIPYLGAKDSLVTCESVMQVDAPPPDCALDVQDSDFDPSARDAVIIQLAALVEPTGKTPPLTLENLLPSQRDKRHYALGTYFVPGTVESQGNVRIFRRG